MAGKSYLVLPAKMMGPVLTGKKGTFRKIYIPNGLGEYSGHYFLMTEKVIKPWAYEKSEIGTIGEFIQLEIPSESYPALYHIEAQFKTINGERKLIPIKDENGQFITAISSKDDNGKDIKRDTYIEFTTKKEVRMPECRKASEWSKILTELVREKKKDLIKTKRVTVDEKRMKAAKSVDILDAAKLIGLHPTGRSNVRNCREHESLKFDIKKQTYAHWSLKDSGQKFSGSAIDLLVNEGNMETKEAIRKLAEFAGFTEPEKEKPEKSAKEKKQKKKVSKSASKAEKNPESEKSVKENTTQKPKTEKYKINGIKYQIQTSYVDGEEYKAVYDEKGYQLPLPDQKKVLGQVEKFKAVQKTKTVPEKEPKKTESKTKKRKEIER